MAFATSLEFLRVKEMCKIKTSLLKNLKNKITCSKALVVIFYLLVYHGLQWVPVRWSSDIWSFRLHGQFLTGPERNGISYNKISRIYGHLWPKFGIYGQFSRSLRRFTRLWMPLETVDAVGAGLTAMRAFR